jgi:hypothetical protein
MFDARVQCAASATLRYDDGTSRSLRLREDLDARIACDPYVYFAVAKHLCAANEQNADFVDLDLSLRSRRATDPALRDVIDARSFCASGATYRAFAHNDWIAAR